MTDRILKPGWQWVKFGDVVRQVKDRVDPATSGLERYVAGEHMDTDDLRIRRWGTIDDGYLGPAFHMRFRPGQVLYGSRRTYLRKMAVADFEGICANTTFVLEAKNPKVMLPGLLSFVMQSETFHNHSIKQSKGSVNPYVNFSDLAWFEFALPPLEVQQTIVAAYTAIQNAAEAQLAVLKSAKKQFQAALNELINPIVQGWSCARLGECFQVVSGGTPRRDRPEYWGGDIPWIKTGEVNYSRIMSTEERISDLGMRNSAAKLMPPDTVLMALFGQGPTLGRVAQLGIHATTNQACAAILPNDHHNMRFLYYYLWRSYEEIRTMARGAAQPNLNLAIVKSLDYPLVPNSLQDSLAETLAALESAIHTSSSRLAETRKLFGQFAAHVERVAA